MDRTFILDLNKKEILAAIDKVNLEMNAGTGIVIGTNVYKVVVTQNLDFLEPPNDKSFIMDYPYKETFIYVTQVE